MEAPPIVEWTRIEVGQQRENGEYRFYISINGKETHSVRNNHPREFHDVKVYASNPWYTAQPGSIRNLTIVSSYPDVNLKNNYITSVIGEVHYVSWLCSDDDYSLASGQIFKNFRGVCLIKAIIGHYHDSHSGKTVDCIPYESTTGTSYSKFAIIKSIYSTGCTITRVTT